MGNPFSGFFYPQDQKNVPQGLRQKIALAMLMQKRAYPKTFGEGLAAIGDAIGDRYGIIGIEKEAAAAEAAGQAARDEYARGGTPPPSSVKASSFAPTDSVEPGAPQSPDQPPVLATIQSQHPDMLQNQKQPLVTTPPAQQPPAALFNPNPVMPPPAPGPQGMLVDPAQGNSLDDAGLADRTFARQRGIAGIESGGAKDPYSLLGAQTRTGDRAYGKYQVMGNNIPSWTQAALGQSMTPQQFLANPQAQDAVFNHRFGQYADKYGEQGAAKAWYAGERGMQNPNATDMHGRLTVADYGNDFARQAGAPDPRGAATAALVAQGGQPQPFAPAEPAGPAGLPPEILTGRSQSGGQTMAFNGQPTPPPAAPQIRTAPPPPQAQIQQAPPPSQPQQGPGPGYVLKLGPEPTPPPTQTDGMRRIQNIIRNTPPSQRESVKAALADDYAQEQAKLAQQNVIYQDELKSRHELIKLQEEQRQKADKDIRDARTDSQKWITTAPASGTVGGGQQGPDPRLGTPQSPQRQGPTIGPVPAGDIPERWSKQEAEKIEKQKESYQKAQPELTETLDIIDKINKHPAKPYATGMFSGVTAMTPSGKGFTALNEQLIGKNLVDAYQKLQGTGQIGEKEGANFAKARARLTAAASEADYNEALKDLSDTVRGTLERSQRNLKMPVTAWQKTNDDAYAPDVGEIQKGHEYLGGDPGNPRSWRKAR